MAQKHGIQIHFTKHCNSCSRNLKDIAEGNLKGAGKGREMLCSWGRKLCLVKMSLRVTLIYRFNRMSIKNPADFFLVEINKLTVNLCGRTRELE